MRLLVGYSLAPLSSARYARLTQVVAKADLCNGARHGGPMVDEGSVSRWCQAQGFSGCGDVFGEPSERSDLLSRARSASRVIMHTPLEEAGRSAAIQVGTICCFDARRLAHDQDPVPESLLGPASAPAHART